MTILVEGMDNAGKTTLALALSEAFGIPLVRRTGPAPKAEMDQRVSDLLLSTETEIHDRCSMFSEMVYGPPLRGQSVFGDKNWEYIWLLCWKNPLIIYCRPPKEQIFNFGDREQMEGVIAQKSILLDRYDELMNVVQMMMPNQDNFVAYDWTVPNAFEHLIQLTRWYILHRDLELRKMKKSAELYKHLITGVKA